jgi:RNA polymerase sigma-70 factor (ECF subfamily)
MPAAGFRNVIDSLRIAVSLQEALVLPDGQLLERYVAIRDEVAFEALVRRHGPMVLGVCRRLLANPCDAEDAFQATFLVLARKASSVQPREKVGSFLYGVAYRAAQKTRAAIVRRRERERQVQTLPEPATVADGLWHDLVPLLDQELNRLPEKYRLPLVLCDLEGRTRSEAAEHLRRPEGTAASRLARGRALLASRLSRHGLPVSAGVLTAVLAQNAASAYVPVALVADTGNSAAAFVGGSAPSAVSGKAAILTTEILQVMLRDKLKIVMAGVLLATVTLGFGGVLMHRVWAGKLSGSTEVATAAELPSGDKRKPDKKKPGPAKDAAARELEALQGEWKVVGLETQRGQAPADDLKGMRWIFKGNQMQPINPGGAPSEKGEVKLDPGKNPKQIDLVILEGPPKGTRVLGIYKLEKGRLTICLRNQNAAKKGRPTDFTIEEGGDDGIITLESLKNPPRPADKPKPPPPSEKAETDVMQGKRWLVKSPDTLQLVGPTGPIGAPVKLPRFHLEVGQELAYTGEMQMSGDRGRKIRIRRERHLRVIRANKDGGWRVVLRSASIMPHGTFGNPEQKRVSFAWCDLFPDGRLGEHDSSGMQTEARYLLARLPADAAEAARGWVTKEKRSDETYRYRLLPAAKAGQCAVEAILESAPETAAGVTIKAVLTWDSKRGLPETTQLEAAYVDRGMERATLKLGEVKTHDPAWCRELAADAERYFAADAAYHHKLTQKGRAPAEAKAELAKAEASLKAARCGLKRVEFRERLDAMLAEHEQQAKAVLDEAERRTAMLGKPAPDWSTTDLEGKRHALKDYRGKVVILDFWYRTCSWCIRAMPQVKEIATRFADRPVVVLGMNTDPKEADAQIVVKKMGLNYATLKAAGLPEKYKVQGFPTLVVVDQEGIVRDIHVGYSPTLKEEVVRTVERLLKAKR